MRERRELLSWARDRAIHVEADLQLDGFGNARTPAVSQLVALDALLDSLLEGKRIAYLGESNHFIHEKYAYRLLFLQHLIARGFRCIGEELAWTDGIWIERYLASGDESCLDRVAAYGYEGSAREDRDDAPQGILGKLTENQPAAALGFEQRRFDAALRTIAQGRAGEGSLRFFGFDVDYVPSAGYEVFVPWLEAADDRGGPVAAMRRAVARVAGESKREEAERLEAAVAHLDAERAELARALGDERVGALRRSIRTTAISHRYVALADEAHGYPALAPAMALREELMAEQVREVLAARDVAGGLVLMSHNHHLARDDDGIRTPTGGAGPGGGIRPSIGCAIAQEHPDEVFVVWMLEGQGRDSSPLPGWSGRVKSPRGTLNRLLAEVGEAFVLPIRTDDPRARLLRSEVDYMTMNGGRMRAVLPDQADALFFVRDVTPLESA